MRGGTTIDFGLRIGPAVGDGIALDARAVQIRSARLGGPIHGRLASGNSQKDLFVHSLAQILRRSKPAAI